MAAGVGCWATRKAPDVIKNREALAVDEVQLILERER
jgi:hypothetical protein